MAQQTVWPVAALACLILQWQHCLERLREGQYEQN
jgi:hypothetical protein